MNSRHEQFNRRYAFKAWWKRALIALMDFAGYLIFAPFRFKSVFVPHKIQRILIIRLDSLGDVLMTRPAVHALRKHLPHARIELLVSEKWEALFRDTTEVDEVIALKENWLDQKLSWMATLRNIILLSKALRRKKFDLAIDFRGDLLNILLMTLAGIPRRYGYGITGGDFLLTHSAHYAFDRHQVFVNLALVDDLVQEEDPGQAPLAINRERYRKFWDKEAIRRLGEERPRIVIHPGAAYPSKRWPGQKYRELIMSLLNERLGSVILIGTRKEKEEMKNLNFSGTEILDLRGETTLEELPVLFEACDVYIGNDSGPAHLAAAQGMEIISIFSGTNDFRVWHPWTKTLHLFRHDVPCSPCEAKECPLKHHDCMEKISMNDVLSKLKEILVRKGQLRHPERPSSRAVQSTSEGSREILRPSASE
ncbi:MAG: glycosyltransferase family 9 protein [Candidatus Omnitrophica bacterium]|nr:glycosyltransferase family 9 protein [Candidatus Omnitrophota bacterium]